MKKSIEPTKWMYFECEKGARWTSTTDDYDGKDCSFSGCLSDHKIKKVKTSPEAPLNWFKKPYDVWENSQLYKNLFKEQ